MATKETNPTDAPTYAFAPVQNTTYIEFITQAGDSYLEILSAQQDQALKFTQAVVAALPKAADFTVPVAATPGVNVPTSREVVEAGFKFADKYLSNQKAYAEKFLALAKA